MAVTRTVGAAFNRRIGRHRVRAGVTLVGILKSDRHLGLATAYRDEGDANRPTVPQPGTKIRVQGAIGANRVYISGRVGVNRRCVNRRIPDVIGGENVTTGDLWWRRRGCWRGGCGWLKGRRPRWLMGNGGSDGDRRQPDKCTEQDQ